jgi:hypothetical protein
VALEAATAPTVVPVGAAATPVAAEVAPFSGAVVLVAAAAAPAAATPGAAEVALFVEAVA